MLPSTSINGAYRKGTRGSYIRRQLVITSTGLNRSSLCREILGQNLHVLCCRSVSVAGGAGREHGHLRGGLELCGFLQG